MRVLGSENIFLSGLKSVKIQHRGGAAAVLHLRIEYKEQTSAVQYGSHELHVASQIQVKLHKVKDSICPLYQSHLKCFTATRGCRGLKKWWKDQLSVSLTCQRAHGGLVKTQAAGTRSQSQEVWGGTSHSAFLTGSQVMGTLPVDCCGTVLHSQF